MPINETRITWLDNSTKDFIIIEATLDCTDCGQLFTRKIQLPKDTSKQQVWEKKEQASYELEQHKH